MEVLYTMSDSLRTVLIEDSRIADITDQEIFGVQSSASQSTYQQFLAVSSSASSIVFNIQVPSENIVIDRHVLIQSHLTFEVTINNVPVGEPCPFSYGVSNSIQAFPLNSLFTTCQTTINNVSTSSNLQDILPIITRMNDKRTLARYNSLTPSLCDYAFGLYSDAIQATNNPLAGFTTNSYDDDFVPRGAFPVEITPYHYSANGVLIAQELGDCQAIGDYWKIKISGVFTEPFLALSPFINTNSNNKAGLVGINNMSVVLNIDSTCKRLFSNGASVVNGAGNGLFSYITSITLGSTADNTPAFQNTRLLFNFLSLQPDKYAKISTKNIVPYIDYPRYLSSFNNTYNCPSSLVDGVFNKQVITLTSQSIQLSQIPDLIFVVARYPMAQQNWNYSSSFLAIQNISVNFNNSSGLLASATQQDLYNVSFRNGSAQSWNEFSGVAYTVNNRTRTGKAIATSGSLLVLNPVYDFGLPPYLSGSSLGQYQFQFNLQVYNQFPFSIVPEICIVTMNGGIFASQQGKLTLMVLTLIIAFVLPKVRQVFY